MRYAELAVKPHAVTPARHDVRVGEDNHLPRMREPKLEWTLGDMYAMADAWTRREMEDDFQNASELISRDIDPFALRLVRTGGHDLRVTDTGGVCEVQIDIYRTGRAYGFWSLGHSPEGHEVRIDHQWPTSYTADGRWMTLRPIESWTVAASLWKKDPVAFIEDLMGKRIAREVAPLLRLPPNVAPDAQIG